MSAQHRRAATLLTALASAVVATAAIAPAAGAQPTDDVSHRSRYGHAVYVTNHRSTRVEVSVGWNDPAGAPVTKTLEVEVTQSWCSGTKVVERTLSGAADGYVGKTNPAYSYTTAAAAVKLSGTQTTTPAGPGCASPESARATTKNVALDSVVITDIRGRGEKLAYTEDDGGQYSYQEASASGALLTSEWGGWYGFEREAREPGETWLWEGFWADARGVDVEAMLPVS